MTLYYQSHLKPEKILPGKFYYETQLNQCEQLWKTFISPRCASDLWEFRLCFHKYFQHKPFFIVMEDHKGVAGMVPLSYVRNMDTYFLFPGEMWNNRTWLERTPVYTREDHSIYDLLRACPKNSYLRYLEVSDVPISPDFSEDEIGYVIYPGDMDFDIEKYFKRFSNKKLKAINKIIQSYLNSGCKFYHNRLKDFDRLVEMSLQQFRHKSFMYDKKFRNGFKDMLTLLHDRKMLRMVSCVINGELAAVDIGAVFQGTYTVFLGGTDFRFPGIAKLMNMNHIDYAFKEKFYKIDFLCGDFNWKLLWHLDPEILYRYESYPSARESVVDTQYSTASILTIN